MTSLYHDIRYAFRTCLKSPGFTAIVVVTLALGIGANTAIFSMLDATVLQPLPFENAERLVIVAECSRDNPLVPGPTSYPNLRDWRDQSRSLEGVAGFRRMRFTLTGRGAAERIDGARVSAEFFPLLRVAAALGRAFEPEDDLAGAEDVVVISDGFWQQRFGADPNALGQTIVLDGLTCVVVGVLPAGFEFPAGLADAGVWMPAALDADSFDSRNLHFFDALGRLAPGVTLSEAQAEMDAIAQQLEQQYPESNAGFGIRLIPLHERVVGDVRGPLLVLLGAVGLVLLIACANVANLGMARNVARLRELAIRRALGAGRWHLVRQLMTESILLGLLGGGLGVMLAGWGVDILVATAPAGTPRLRSVAVDGNVLAFAAALSVMVGVLYGAVPALRASTSSPAEVLKDGERTTGGRARQRLSHGFVVAQVALATVLLVGAGLLLRSFQHLTAVDPGFQPANILTFQMSIPWSEYDDPGRRASVYKDVLRRLARLPGVRAVGATTALPLTSRLIELNVVIHGRPAPAPGHELTARSNSISSDYFRTLGVPLSRRRFFTEQDCLGAPGVAIINETMAKRYWPGEDPLGQRISPSARFSDEDPESFEIVGIVGDMRAAHIDASSQPTMYFPYQQQTWPYMGFALRTSVVPQSVIASVRHEVAAVVADEATFAFMTMEQYIARSVGPRRFPALLLGVFASVALGLAALGIFGTLSFNVAQRPHEIGLRMAIGAQVRDVLHLVLKQGMCLALAGLLLGLLAALGATRTLAGLLYEIQAIDSSTFASAALVLMATALLACYFPARRAARVDPMVALRCE